MNNQKDNVIPIGKKHTQSDYNLGFKLADVGNGELVYCLKVLQNPAQQCNSRVDSKVGMYLIYIKTPTKTALKRAPVSIERG